MARQRVWTVVSGLVAVAGLAVAVVFLYPIVRYHSTTLTGASMLPTIQPNAHLRSEPIDGAPRPGEIVLLRQPMERASIVVKRVVAIGGQRVSVRDGRLFVDGRPADEPYLARGQRTNPIRPTTVPAGTVYFLGDNRQQQLGSDYLGPPPVRDVLERVVDVDAPPTGVQLAVAAVGLLVAIVGGVVCWRMLRQSGRSRSSASTMV